MLSGNTWPDCFNSKTTNRSLRLIVQERLNLEGIKCKLFIPKVHLER